MRKTLLIRGARQLLTLQGALHPRRGTEMQQLGIIENGALLAKGGIITHVGPTRRIENLADAKSATLVEAHGKVVMPGFIDSHICLTPGPPRLADFEQIIAGHPLSAEQSAESQNSLQRYLRQTPTRTLEFQARRIIGLCGKHGTTSFGARCGTGLDDNADLKCLRALAATTKFHTSLQRVYLGACPLQSPMPDAVRWREILDVTVPSVRQRYLADSIDLTAVAHQLQSDGRPGERERLQRTGLPVRFRSQSRCTINDVRQARELGAAGLDAVQSITAEAVVELGGHPLLTTLLPAAPAARDSGPAGRWLIEAGVPLVVASGFDHCVVRTYSMSFVLALACLYLGMTPAQAICAATINAAHALDCDNRVGSLEYGKEADVLILHVGDYRELPYHVGLNLVATTVKKGEILSETEEP